MKSTTRLILLLSTIALVTPLVRAHDVWLVSKGDHLELLYGHATSESYDPSKVTELKAYDNQATALTLKTLKLDKTFGITPDPRTAMITVVFDNGYWVEAGSTDWKNVAFAEANKDPKYSHPIKYHKSLYAWSDVFARPIGMKFEIVPQKNPFTVKIGELLPVQVLFDGKPLPGVDVEYGIHGDKAPKVKADSQGKALIPVTAPGEQFIAVDYKMTGLDPSSEAAHRSYATSLRYERP